jgi:hypothetical protein
MGGAPVTARERAEEAIRKMNSMSPFDPTDEDVDFVVEAILAAEAAAYERALACVFDAICDGCGRELDMDRLRERIRLAKKGGEG